MKTRVILLLVLVLLLMLTGVVLAQSEPPRQSHLWYQVEQITLTGNGYHLLTRTWQFQKQTSGGGYHLQSLNVPDLRGNGCCCTYLPCQWQSAP